jgi:5-formyltetrahydrofolate cyclo-ligase
MPDPLQEMLREKQELRLLAAARRNAEQQPDALSQRIWDRLLALPQFARARTVMTYLDIGGEARTRHYVPELWRLEKRVVVPYCVAHELRLFELRSMEELTPGTWQILEPRPQWRARPERRPQPTDLDLILVPGLAFDRSGGRLGLGKGYYDRFLKCIRPDVPKIAPAFECQLVDEIPVSPHDVRVDMVVTEKAVYSAGNQV